MLDIIYKRKSIRQFSPRIVTDEIIEKIIRAGMQAPSSGNSQPWEFVVIRNRNTLQKITEFHSYSQCLKMVNAAVVVCANLSREIFKGFWVQDCSACVQNMLLAVESMKGSCCLYPKMLFLLRFCLSVIKGKRKIAPIISSRNGYTLKNGEKKLIFYCVGRKNNILQKEDSCFFF